MAVPPVAVSDERPNIDKQLEETAAKKNLSVHNVKSILHVSYLMLVYMYTCMLSLLKKFVFIIT